MLNRQRLINDHLFSVRSFSFHAKQTNKKKKRRKTGSWKGQVEEKRRTQQGSGE